MSFIYRALSIHTVAIFLYVGRTNRVLYEILLLIFKIRWFANEESPLNVCKLLVIWRGVRVFFYVLNVHELCKIPKFNFHDTRK